ncbi:MAG TPA: epoxide hydrolase [Candidatus Binatia bacterium]|nr:epoxide hydrolase [Candidatus Binatia bacterium]
MKAERFEIAIPDSALTDLRDRLARTRFAEDFANDQWAYGTNGAYLAELVGYWRESFDWRAQEKAMNAFSHYRTTIEDVPIHFIYEKGRGPRPMPIVLSHGWPWTFWDLQKVIRPLADPAAFGGDPQDAFDVVVPSLPGYGFSTPLRKTGFNFWRTADLWTKLMQDVLGYGTFAAEGGDWGALVTAQLGHKYADRVLGVYVHLLAPLDIFLGALPAASEYGPGEEGWFERNLHFFTAESGYSALQSTKPQTIAFALNDSPAGLLSWLVEKRRTWSDCGGDVETRFTKDDLCTTAMLYWATGSYGTSARYYYECTHNPWRPSHDRQPVVEAPTGVGVFKDVVLLPRKWAERYYNVKQWTAMPRGGHFAPMEEPELLVQDVRKFFRRLRG